MANEYYDEVCREMEECLKQKEYQQVIRKMDEELSMPYIPLAFEQRFRQYRKEARAMLASEQPVKQEIMDIETFETLLFDGSLEVELLAVEGLRQLNIDPYLPFIGRYLENPRHEETQSLLIYELIDRGVREEFMTQKDGFSVTFTPYYLELPQETEAYACCIGLLESWLAKNPSLLQLCIQILQVQFMKHLPLSYDEDEAVLLSASVAKYACDAMDDAISWQEVLRESKVSEKDLINISLDG